MLLSGSPAGLTSVDILSRRQVRLARDRRLMGSFRRIWSAVELWIEGKHLRGMSLLVEAGVGKAQR